MRWTVGCGEAWSETGVRRGPAWPALFLLVLLTLWSAPASAEFPAAELVAALSKGGYVLFIRHASRDGRTDARPVDPRDCRTQSLLSEEGRQEARRLGEALRRHAIPIGRVVSSEYCRCTETAQLAFGRFASDAGLNSFYNLDLPQDEVERRVATLRTLVSTRPREGENVAVVGHQWHYLSMTGKGIGTSEVAVFLPSDGTYRELGRIALRDLEQVPATP